MISNTSDINVTTDDLMNKELRYRVKSSKTELNDEISHKKLKMYVCTWNVNSKNPNFKIDKLLQFEKFTSPDEMPDIYVIGLQEVNSQPFRYFLDLIYNDPWTNEFTKQLSKFDYFRLKSIRLVGILMNIFVKKKLVSYIRYSIEDWVRLGFCGLWGNKGANLCTLKIGNRTMCFINAHLSAHENNRKTRANEYKTIIKRKIDLKYDTETIDQQDHTLFFGDLNYRLHDVDIETIKEKIESKEYNLLLQHDQLKLSIGYNECFYGFKEESINFAPTYKFDVNTHTYDTSLKRRRPAWCDRILFKTSEYNDLTDCKPEIYNSIAEFDQSDHKPVYAIFNIKTQNWENWATDIVFASIQPTNDNFVEVSYSISENCLTSPNDWIGIYNVQDPGMGCSNDYVAYQWAKRVPEYEKVFKI